MHAASDLIEALAVVLCVAAVTTLVFLRLRQPVVLGYILAGLAVGPHVPIPLVADPEQIGTIAELGVILLMFSLGLEFSVSRLVKLGPTAGITAVIQCSFMMWLGFQVGALFGWTTIECLFTGAIIAISSTTIIAKAFDEQRVVGRLRDVVVGILIVEDLIAVLLMAALTTVAAGSGVRIDALALAVAELAGFLIGLLVVGMLVVPRAIRAVQRLQRPETTTVVAVGLCFAVSLLAHRLGYSVALGAFIAGSLVAESGEGEAIEHLLRPLRDVFGAIFFVSVGMMIDPAQIAAHGGAIAVLCVVVVVGKVTSVALGAFVTGAGTRTSIAAGMSLAQIGEFSFIIAGLGLTLDVTGGFLFPIAVAVSAITTLTTPWLIRASDPVARWVDRALPRPVQTFVSLYGSWIDRLRARPAQSEPRTPWRRFGWRLLVDGVALAVITVAVAIGLEPAAVAITADLEVTPAIARLVVALGALLLIAPFAWGVLRTSRRLGVVLAASALPAPAAGQVDLALAPRRAFTIVVQFACILAATMPVLAVSQPVLGTGPGALVVLALVLVVGVFFWRSATSLHEHVRAASQVLLEAMASGSRATAPAVEPASDELTRLLPGIGRPVTVRLDPGSHAVGKTLGGLDLRGRTGATVIAIQRPGGDVVVPSADELLHLDDALALVGDEQAVAAASALLTTRTHI